MNSLDILIALAAAGMGFMFMVLGYSIGYKQGHGEGFTRGRNAGRHMSIAKRTWLENNPDKELI